MWRRVCEVIERPELAGDERYATPTHRVRINSQIDHMVEAWTLQHPVSYCIERLIAAALPCGPIYSIAELLQEASLVHREMVRELHDPVSGKSVRVPGALFHATAASGRAADSIPAPGADREFIEQRVLLTTCMAKKRSGSAASARPLTGIRVIEIGSYTTAPLCARQLAALGADVVKVEPPIGDPARVLPPFLGRQGYFFTMNNSDKRAVTLDLRTSEGKTALRDLLACADVFVDNLKPGSLSRLGFGRDDLARLNPRLIHCSVSGFGADSPLADRPGMDTTIQGMAGIMYLTRSGDTPFKTGVSIADLTGAQLALAAILASLAYRERVGKGLAIDLSMQDAGAWLTRGAWNGQQSASAPATLIRCEDGYVVAEAAADALRTAVPEHLSSEAGSDALTARLTREAIVTLLESRSVRSASVLRVGEVLQQPQTKVRELIVKGTAPDGTEWPLLASPIRLALTPAAVKRPIGDAAPDASGVLVEWLETNQKERKSLNA
jgi:crotonobetainyl-CoA:carnitine CoA-transferase CaiB-like acyl-CoA transferase